MLTESPWGQVGQLTDKKQSIQKRIFTLFLGHMTTLTVSLMIVAVFGFFLRSIEDTYDQKWHINFEGKSAEAGTEEREQVRVWISKGYVGEYGAPVKLHEKEQQAEERETPAPRSQSMLREDWNNSVTQEGVPSFHLAAVKAADVSAWSAEKIDQRYETMNIEAEKRATFWVDMKNTGNQTWTANGNQGVGIVVDDASTVNPNFSQWPSPKRPANIKRNVAPNETIRITMTLQAPKASKTHTVIFHLVDQAGKNIPGGEVRLKMKVAKKKYFYDAEKKESSGDVLTLAPGTSQEVWVDFRNKGKKTWTKSSSQPVSVLLNNQGGGPSNLYNTQWISDRIPAKLLQTEVKPGKTGRFVFTVTAPQQEGVYEESFVLVNKNGKEVRGGTFTFRVEVGDVEPVMMNFEPQLRVGLHIMEGEMRVGGYNGEVEVIDGDGKVLETLSDTQSVTITYANGKYAAKTPTKNYEHVRPFRVKGKSSDTAVEIENYEERPSWAPNLNFNLYRGSVELAYSEKDTKTWAVNELGIESYLRGLGEAGNNNDEDYLKALVTAARTYAMILYLHPTKYAGRPYSMVDTSADQVYKGYTYETRVPNIVKAVEDTRGKVVTYQGNIVVTPYFSRSDGRTRSWDEVWAGTRPWLKSVADPCCTNSSLWGHGVGMSAQGALYFAGEGKAWDWILHYYYTDIEIKKAYK